MVSMGPRPEGHGNGKDFETLMHSDKNPFCANLQNSYHFIHKTTPLLGHNRYADPLHRRFFQMCRLISMGFLRERFAQKTRPFSRPRRIIDIVRPPHQCISILSLSCPGLGMASSIRLDRMAFEISSKGLINPEAFLYAVDLTANKLFPLTPIKLP